MKNPRTFVLFTFLFAAIACAGQDQDKFTNCTAAFLNDKLVVDEYSIWGRCVLSPEAKGKLTVATAYLDGESSKPTGYLPFMIAIRDGNTKTLMMFSDKVYKEIPVDDVLKKCRQGDYIVLMTMSDEFAMPHNEILVK